MFPLQNMSIIRDSSNKVDFKSQIVCIFYRRLKKLSKLKKIVSVLFVSCLLSWVAVIYGAIVGAAFCGRNALNSGTTVGCRDGKNPNDAAWDAKLNSVF